MASFFEKVYRYQNFAFLASKAIQIQIYLSLNKLKSQTWLSFNNFSINAKNNWQLTRSKGEVQRKVEQTIANDGSGSVTVILIHTLNIT